ENGATPSGATGAKSPRPRVDLRGVESSGKPNSARCSETERATRSAGGLASGEGNSFNGCHLWSIKSGETVRYFKSQLSDRQDPFHAGKFPVDFADSEQRISFIGAGFGAPRKTDQCRPTGCKP